MKTAVIQIDNQYVKWIGWIAGIIPNIPSIYQTKDINEAMVVNTGYLAYRIEKTEKTRKEAIKEKYPNAKFIEVELTIKGEME